MSISHYPVLVMVFAISGSFQACGGGSSSADAGSSETDAGTFDAAAEIADLPTAPDSALRRVCLDEAHNNYHTLAGRYRPFGDALETQGYVVVASSHKLSATSLQSCDVLVIANALNEANVGNWSLPTPSAFTDDEIAALDGWVKAGGSLFLIADHMPFPGAAEKLAAVFGITFYNGFAMRKSGDGPDIFSRSDSTLSGNVITDGRSQAERVDSVQTFTGQAFDLPMQATHIVTLTGEYHVLLPQTAWEFPAGTPSQDANGMAQIGFLRHNAGRVVVSGEAAMFTIQQSTGLPAEDNRQLLFNIFSWLTGQLS